MVILDTCATAHVTVALAAVTRRPDTVRVDALMAGRVTTVRQVTISQCLSGSEDYASVCVCVSVRVWICVMFVWNANVYS